MSASHQPLNRALAALAVALSGDAAYAQVDRGPSFVDEPLDSNPMSEPLSPWEAPEEHPSDLEEIAYLPPEGEGVALEEFPAPTEDAVLVEEVVLNPLPWPEPSALVDVVESDSDAEFELPESDQPEQPALVDAQGAFPAPLNLDAPLAVVDVSDGDEVPSVIDAVEIATDDVEEALLDAEDSESEAIEEDGKPQDKQGPEQGADRSLITPADVDGTVVIRRRGKAIKQSNINQRQETYVPHKKSPAEDDRADTLPPPPMTPANGDLSEVVGDAPVVAVEGEVGAVAAAPMGGVAQSAPISGENQIVIQGPVNLSPIVNDAGLPSAPTAAVTAMPAGDSDGQASVMPTPSVGPLRPTGIDIPPMAPAYAVPMTGIPFDGDVHLPDLSSEDPSDVVHPMATRPGSIPAPSATAASVGLGAGIDAGPLNIRAEDAHISAPAVAPTRVTGDLPEDLSGTYVPPQGPASIDPQTGAPRLQRPGAKPLPDALPPELRDALADRDAPVIVYNPQGGAPGMMPQQAIHPNMMGRLPNMSGDAEEPELDVDIDVLVKLDPKEMLMAPEERPIHLPASFNRAAPKALRPSVIPSKFVAAPTDYRAPVTFSEGPHIPDVSSFDPSRYLGASAVTFEDLNPQVAPDLRSERYEQQMDDGLDGVGYAEEPAPLEGYANRSQHVKQMLRELSNLHDGK